jgi:hypothetical protein
MKRLLIVLLVLIYCAPSAYAQTFKAGATIGESLSFIAACAGVKKVVYDTGAEIQNQRLAVSVTIDTCQTPAGFKLALEKILPGLYTVNFDLDGVLHVHPVTPIVAPAPPAEEPIPSPVPPLRYAPSHRSAGPAVYPSYVPRSAPSLGDMLIMAENGWEPTQISPYYRGNYSNGYAYEGAYPYSTYPWMQRGCSTGPTGYLQFDFADKSDQRKYWKIYVNGEQPGSVTQGDRFWRKIQVCAGSVQIKLEKRDTDKISSYEDNFSVRPETSTKIEVGDFIFDRDDHSERKKRVLKDQ